MQCIGRLDGTVDVCALHPSVSRIHCRLGFDADGSFYVEDNNSTHGTFINKRKLLSNVPTKVGAGSTIRLGTSTRLYHVERVSNRVPTAGSALQPDDMSNEISRESTEASIAHQMGWGMDRSELAPSTIAPSDPQPSNSMGHRKAMLGAPGSDQPQASTASHKDVSIGPDDNDMDERDAREQEVVARMMVARGESSTTGVRGGSGITSGSGSRGAKDRGETEEGAVVDRSRGAGSAYAVLPRSMRRPAGASGAGVTLDDAIGSRSVGRKRRYADSGVTSAGELAADCEEADAQGDAKRSRSEGHNSNSSSNDGIASGSGSSSKTKMKSKGKFGSFRRLGGNRNARTLATNDEIDQSHRSKSIAGN